MLFPTNYELVREADVVLIARAVEYLPGSRGTWLPGRFRFEPVEAVRGGSIAEPLILWGSPEFQPNRSANDFSTSRAGPSCGSDSYRVGSLYVLLLRRNPADSGEEVSTYSLLKHPFARVNEEIAGTESPWAEAVRRYAAITSRGLPPGSPDEAAALRALRDAAASPEPPPGHPPGLIADIDDHFLRPTDFKTARELLQLFETGTTPESRTGALTALANRKDPEAVELVRRLVAEARIPPGSEWNVARIAAFAGDDRLTDWLLAFTRSLEPGADDRLEAIDALVECGRPSDRDALLQILVAATAQESARLAPWFADRRPAEACDILFRKLVADPNAEVYLVAALAELGDERVLKRSVEPDGRAWSFPYLPSLALARSPLPEADDALDTLIDAGSVSQLISVTLGLAESRAPQRDARLARIWERAPADLRLRCWLRSTLQQIRTLEPQNPEIARLQAALQIAHPDPEQLRLHCE